MALTTETIPFDFDSLYTGLQEKFADLGYDTAEGSNTSQLITAMAYLTSMLNANTAVNVNETLLPLATKRKTALYDARALGYETSHIQSYEYLLNINIASDGTHFIPKYSKFTADGKTFYYMGERLEYSPDPVTYPNGQDIQIVVKEGTLHRFIDNPNTLVVTTQFDDTENAPQHYVDIPYPNVEADGIEVYLSYVDDFGTLIKREEWKQSKQFLIDADTILEKEFIRLDDIDYQTPRIYFKISGVGPGVRVGTIVEMNALVSSGTAGGLSDWSTATFVHSIGDTGIVVTSVEQLETQGSDQETLESIKLNAPIFHNSANRAVTGLDYTAICNKQGAVNKTKVWGGDEEYPKIPGHIWFSYLPSATERSHSANSSSTVWELDDPTDIIKWFVEDKEIKSTTRDPYGNVINPGIWDVLDNYKIPTLEFQNRHPLYLDFSYSLEILKYNVKTSKADIHKAIFDITDAMFTGEANDTVDGDSLVMEDFDVEYFHSNWEKRVDQNIQDISGFNNELKTELLITTKNVSQENIDADVSDIYIPLAIPYEEIFNVAGKLIISRLPSIDTESFIPSYNLGVYTDWSGAGAWTSLDKLIVAPVRSKQTETYSPPVGASFTSVNFDKAVIYPDFNDADTLTYNKVTITKTARKQLYNIEMSGQLVSNYSLNPATLIEALTSAPDFIGKVTIQADGTFLYAASMTDVAYLTTGASETQEYQITAVNGLIYSFTITINGNDDPNLMTISVDSADVDVTNNGTAVPVFKYGLWEADPSVPETELLYGADWTFDPLNPSLVNFIEGGDVNTPHVYGETDIIHIETNNHIGYYHLFNSYKKYVTVQLFVDSSINYREADYVPTVDQPWGYLTSVPPGVDEFGNIVGLIGNYWFTTDNYYVTTEGFVVGSEDDLTPLTGRIIRKITKENYTNSLLKRDMFNTARYLDFNYSSPNFRVYQNVIPRLRHVDFNLNSGE